MKIMSIIQKLAVTGIAVGFLAPALAFAQTPSNISSLLAQIQSLQAQIAALQAEQKVLVEQRTEAVATLAKALREGSSGDDVSVLQALLAADPSIYPEGLITGFYGPKTAAAVKRFQKLQGIDQVGHVGPKTLKALNRLLEDHPIAFASSTSTPNRDDDDDDDSDEDRGKKPCAIVPPGHLIAPGWLKKHDGVRPVVPECQKLPPGIKDKWHATTTPPVADTMAPVISLASVSSIATTSASVSWNTNEAATGKVYYATSSPVTLATATNVSHDTLTLSHMLSLTGLTASTTYYYVLESKDAANNVATTSAQSFVTTN